MRNAIARLAMSLIMAGLVAGCDQPEVRNTTTVITPAKDGGVVSSPDAAVPAYPDAASAVVYPDAQPAPATDAAAACMLGDLDCGCMRNGLCISPSTLECRPKDSTKPDQDLRCLPKADAGVPSDSGVHPDASVAAPRCIEGAQQPCGTPDGRTGFQTCQPNGTFVLPNGANSCIPTATPDAGVSTPPDAGMSMMPDAGPSVRCTPLQTQECNCPDSRRGAQSCAPNGQGFETRCQCEPDATACIPGRSVPCITATQRIGAQVCNATGTGFGLCESRCQVNDQEFCSCPDGRFSQQTCQANGEFGACQCSTSTMCSPNRVLGCACGAGADCATGLMCLNGTCSTSAPMCTPMRVEGCACGIGALCDVGLACLPSGTCARVVDRSACPARGVCVTNTSSSAQNVDFGRLVRTSTGTIRRLESLTVFNPGEERCDAASEGDWIWDHNFGTSSYARWDAAKDRAKLGWGARNWRGKDRCNVVFVPGLTRRSSSLDGNDGHGDVLFAPD